MTEQSMGCPIISQMDVVELAHSDKEKTQEMHFDLAGKFIG